MADIRAEIFTRVAAIWRRRWLALAVSWGVCAAGWFAVFTIPDQYASEAKLYVDTDTLLGPLLRNLAIENDLPHQVQVMQRTLLSRPNLQQVLVSTDMAQKATTAAEEQALYDKLEKNTAINAQGPNLFTISYMDSDPVLARDVVQALITILMESNTGQNRTEMEKARNFIEKQIATYEDMLKTIEQKMAEYKTKHLDELASGASGFNGRVEGARQSAAAARREAQDAAARRDRLRQQLASVPQYIDVESAPQVIVTGQMDPTQARITQLQSALTNLRMQFTEKHPDVVATQQALNDLLEEAKKAKEHPEPGAVSRGRLSNPVYEQTQMRLLDAEQTAEAAERHRIQAEDEEKHLSELANSAPAIEAEYNDLAREYGVQKKQYEELLGRRESARISEAVQNSSNKIQFRVIEPPNVPIKPAGPKRILFLSIVLIAGIGIGVGFAFVLNLAEDPVSSKEALMERFAFPVLGQISMVHQPGHRRRQRQRAIKFSLAALTLVLAFVGVLAFAFIRLNVNHQVAELAPEWEGRLSNVI